MQSKAPSAEALAEWRAHPVTEALRDSLRWQMDRERAALTQAYWAGQPVSEDRRLAYLRKVEVWEDLFEAPAGDLAAVMEKMNDPEDG